VTGGDLSVVVVSVAALLATAALGGAAVWLVLVVRDLRRAVDRLTVETDRTLVEMRAVVDQAEDDLERADSVIATLESVSDRVDAASELAVETFSRPVIKAVSLGSGTARAARKLRGRG
jgi:hypothetical protein